MRDLFVEANRLRHHLLEWPGEGPPLLLLHGFLEHGHAFDLVAPRIAAAGHRVLALDLRGHGDSGWVGAGGYYHFADYAADLGLVTRALGLERFALLGHSMGGAAAINYAGTEPERVAALVTIEGLGPPGMEPSSAPERYAAWIGDLLRTSDRSPRTVASVEEAARRLAERWPELAGEPALHLARFGTRAENGGLVWKFDPLHQTRSPQPYVRAQAEAFWCRVSCPVLFVRGDSNRMRGFLPDVDERLAILRARSATIGASGHHPHLEAPEATARAIVEFLAPLRAEAR